MVSKGDLGVSYFLAVGVGLFGALVTGALAPAGAPAPAGPASILAVVSALTVAVGFTLAGAGLARSDLAGDRIWRVATWATLGLAVPTAVVVLAGVAFPGAIGSAGWRGVAITNVASGGIVGVLVGTLLELRAENARRRTLSQRNAVFLRLFRHDIRTSLNVIRGHADLLAADEVPVSESVAALRDQADHVERLSEAARRLDDLESGDGTEPVDLAALVRDRVGDARRAHPDLSVEAAVEPGTHADANDLLATVVDDLIDNVIEHAGRDATLSVTVRPVEAGSAVELRVGDDGPGFSAAELAVHARATETGLQHSDGVGLWLTRWIVESYGGDLSVENAPGGGARVTVRLPAARPPGDGRSASGTGGE